MSGPGMESGSIDLTKGIPAPQHPPFPGPEREQWTGWKEWDQYCRIVQQHNRLRELGLFIAPILNHYYNLDEARLGSINLPEVDFPEPPDVEEYSYDEVHEYLKEFYQKTLEVALPHSPNYKKNGHNTRQTTLGRYLFLYQGLQVSKSATTIRLLEVLPAATESDSLVTRLFTADLDFTGLTYEALSYTWGVNSSTDKKHYIYVNGYKQSVTSNLHSALSSLRHPSQSRTLWVDSICINQADLQERYHQVLLMARIYAGASKVLVYLGPSTPPSAMLFKVLQSPVCDPATFGEDEDNEDAANPTFWKMCHDVGPELIEGFIDINSRSWWNRVWVLQEYTLNKRDPVMYCGRFKVDNHVLSRNFQRLYSWVEHRRRHPVLLDNCHHPACDKTYISLPQADGVPLTSEDKDKGKQVAADMVDPKHIDPKARRSILPPQGSAGREWTIWGRQVWKVKSVMTRRNHCSPYALPYYSVLGLQSQCTNPHDMVYGQRELMDPLFRSLFPPDYMVSLPTLFTRFAAYLIIMDRNVDIFWHFPYQLRDNDVSESQSRIGGNVRDVPSWVPDFRKPRMIKYGDEPPSPHKEKSEVLASIPHILDRVLFMDGLLLDEIIEVFPLPLDNPFLLLQQLWYVERSFWKPRYLRDGTTENDRTSGKAKDEFEDMMSRLGGVTVYPSIMWATGDANRLTGDISIVDVIDGLTSIGPLLLELLEKYTAMIPKLVDIIMDKERRTTGVRPADPGAERGAPDDPTPRIDDPTLTSGTASLTLDPSRDDLINEMELRFLEFTRHMINGATWKDFVGICTFDYDNFRSQILHRLLMLSAQRVADVLGDKPGLEYLKEGLGARGETAKCAITHSPISYVEYIEAIDDGRHPLEIRLREGFVIDLATKIHKTTVDMVGLEGDTVFENVNLGDVQRDFKDAKEASRRCVCMLPLLESDDMKKRQADLDEDNASRGNLSSLNLPHDEIGQPFGTMSRWFTKPCEEIYDVHLSLCDVLDFLAGRELFVTETGLVGITGVGTSGVQDGDDLLLLEGMSYPLIGRLEPSPQLGSPKKRRRDMPTKMMKREILGTAVVKDIDPKDGNLDEATMPSWFEDISEGSRGLFRFS